MIAKFIGPNEMIPRGYGVAWVDYAQHRSMCLPIPINVIWRCVAGAWCRCKHGWWRGAQRHELEISGRDAKIGALQRRCDELEKQNNRLIAETARLKTVGTSLFRDLKKAKKRGE